MTSARTEMPITLTPDRILKKFVTVGSGHLVVTFRFRFRLRVRV